MLVACGDGGAAPGNTSCSKQVCIQVTVAEPVRINQPVQVTMTVETDQDIPNAHLSIESSDAHWVQANGPTSWDLDIKAHEPVSKTAALVFTHESLYLVDGYVTTVSLNEVNSANILITNEGGVVNPTATR